ncbi:MAG: hypothetical protein ACRCY8_07010 [Dermatophilaceae bacterium]
MPDVPDILLFLLFALWVATWAVRESGHLDVRRGAAMTAASGRGRPRPGGPRSAGHHSPEDHLDHDRRAHVPHPTTTHPITGEAHR